MTNKRFSYKDWEDVNYCEHCFYDGDEPLDDKEVVGLLNTLHQENLSLKFELDECANNKLYSRRKLEEENEQLRQQLQEYKENWDDMVELATKTSLRNIELDEQIGRLQKLNDD